MTERRQGMEKRCVDGEDIERRIITKLLRILVRGSRKVAMGDDGRLRLEGQAGDFPDAALSKAVSLGLAVRDGATVAAMPAAAAFLRRAALESEDRFQDQHRDLVTERMPVEGVIQPVRRNRAESPLAPLMRLKAGNGQAYLPPEAFDAGERLLGDFIRGQMQPRITASWEPRLEASAGRGRAGAGDITDSAMAARDRFSRAVDAMGPELSGVAVDVCCFSKGLERVERERSWPARSAKLMLKTALLALARHYAPPVAQGRRRHHWGDGDFRPRM